MKVGDTAKGFRFKSYDNSGRLAWFNKMIPNIGRLGTVEYIGEHSFQIRFDRTTLWAYPLAEYIKLIREEKFKQLGL